MLLCITGVGGRSHPRVLILLLLMIMLIGLILEPSHALKCFSCEGSGCFFHPSGKDVKECEPSVKACFKSGHQETLIRGCAPKHLMTYFRKHVTKDNKDRNCFSCYGKHNTCAGVNLCYEYGDTLVSEPVLRYLYHDSNTCVCYEDLCNDGHTMETIVYGIWEGGRCRPRTFTKFIMDVSEDANIKRLLGPSHVKEKEDFKKFCGWSAPKKAAAVQGSTDDEDGKNEKMSLEMALATGVLIAAVVIFLFLQVTEYF